MKHITRKEAIEIAHETMHKAERQRQESLERDARQMEIDETKGETRMMMFDAETQEAIAELARLRDGWALIALTSPRRFFETITREIREMERERDQLRDEVESDRQRIAAYNIMIDDMSETLERTAGGEK